MDTENNGNANPSVGFDDESDHTFPDDGTYNPTENDVQSGEIKEDLTSEEYYIGIPPRCWYFSEEQLAHTCSRNSGLSADDESELRKRSAHFIQSMGRRLHLPRLTINTAIVYMHRFYTCKSFANYFYLPLSMSALFLASKVQDTVRPLDLFVRIALQMLHGNESMTAEQERQYSSMYEDKILLYENFIMQLMAMDITVEHATKHVYAICAKAATEDAIMRLALFLASETLLLTTLCIQYKPSTVACLCIHMVCKLYHLKIQPSANGRQWYHYAGDRVPFEFLERLVERYLPVFEQRLQDYAKTLESTKHLSPVLEKVVRDAS